MMSAARLYHSVLRMRSTVSYDTAVLVWSNGTLGHLRLTLWTEMLVLQLDIDLPRRSPGVLDFTVSAPELIRLKKRFMKLDKDGSGAIDKDEFLQIPQIANNPLAHRMIAIFDEE